MSWSEEVFDSSDYNVEFFIHFGDLVRETFREDEEALLMFVGDGVVGGPIGTSRIGGGGCASWAIDGRWGIVGGGFGDLRHALLMGWRCGRWEMRVEMMG